MGVKKTKDGTDTLKKRLKALLAKEVLIGIPAENAGRTDGSPIGNAALGYIHETGMPEQNIPARPWLKPGIKSAEDRLTKIMKSGAEKALAGDAEAADKALHSAGLVAVNAVRARIDEGIPPPLAPATLYKRKHRKQRPRSGEVPLVDSGEMRRSINYAIAKKKDRS